MKRKIISGAVYATTSFALAAFWDALCGSGPFTGSGLIHLGIAGTVVIAAGCIASLFNRLVGDICGLAGCSLAWPCFAIELPGIPWRALVSVARKANWSLLFIALLTVVVATVYSLTQLRSFFRGRPDPAGRSTRLKLAVALLYSTGVFVLTMWHEIWDLLFRLRYGS